MCIYIYIHICRYYIHVDVNPHKAKRLTYLSGVFQPSTAPCRKRRDNLSAVVARIWICWLRASNESRGNSVFLLPSSKLTLACWKISHLVSMIILYLPIRHFFFQLAMLDHKLVILSSYGVVWKYAIMNPLINHRYPLLLNGYRWGGWNPLFSDKPKAYIIGSIPTMYLSHPHYTPIFDVELPEDVCFIISSLFFLPLALSTS